MVNLLGYTAAPMMKGMKLFPKVGSKMTQWPVIIPRIHSPLG